MCSRTSVYTLAIDYSMYTGPDRMFCILSYTQVNGQIAYVVSKVSPYTHDVGLII